MSHLPPLLPSAVASNVPVLHPPPNLPVRKVITREAIRACDPCRKRKIRCDGPEQRERVCTTCTRLGKSCTYTQDAGRPSAPRKSYVQNLEARLEKMEQLLKQQFPDIDIMRELGALTLGTHDVPSPGQMPSDAPESSDSDDYTTTTLTDRSSDAFNMSFFGKSSPFPLVRRAARTKNLLRGDTDNSKLSMCGKRSEFWLPPEFERRMLNAPTPEFHPKLPPPELLSDLVQRYFTSIKPFCPLLHRELFEKQLNDERRNPKFLAVVLLVCACGARLYAKDHPELGEKLRPPGWEWFEQVEPLLSVPTFAAPNLYDIQMFILAFIYLTSNTGTFSAPWNLLGVAIRIAYQAGAHRALVYKPERNLVDELWRRAFWILVVFDRHLCVAFGHGSALREESFDVELPLEVDDQYWDITKPEQSYPLRKDAPLDQPCQLSYFVHNARLSVILGTAARTIYSMNHSKFIMGFIGEEWQFKIRSKLDANLEEWTKSIPTHLRWDPERMDSQWLNQAAALHTSYYHAQIIFHNPFPFIRRSAAPSSVRDGPSGWTGFSTNQTQAFAICINAAHACSRILVAQMAHPAGGRIYPIQVPAAFTSAMMLLVNLWIAKGSSGGLRPVGYSSVIADIRTCMDAVKRVEAVWDSAGRTWDMLNDLVSAYEEHADWPLAGSSLDASPLDAHNFGVDDVVQNPLMAFPVQPMSTETMSHLPNGLYNDIFGGDEDIGDMVGMGFDTLPVELQVLLSKISTGKSRIGMSLGL